MTQLLELWPIIVAVAGVACCAVAFRAEILVRVKVLEEKVSALFDLINKGK
tara:strand:- start:3028 stop:3180 length:153 start_codon:yes stop_codon:yes gene_type:complete